MNESTNITHLLNQWVAGNSLIETELINAVYPLLRAVAHKQLNKVKDSSMNTTLIVNELYLKLRKQNRIKLNNKNHFLALSARLIRQIIVDNIRSNKALKRGLLYQQVTLYEHELNAASSIKNNEMNVDWLTLNKLLNELESIDPESVKLIELRFFAGLNLQEIAEVCNTSVSSVSRNWRFARSWLLNKLKDN